LNPFPFSFFRPIFPPCSFADRPFTAAVSPRLPNVRGIDAFD
jgi:hypothetical protein